MATKIRVLLADDHVVLREATAELLDHQPDMQVVGQVGSGEEALALAKSLQPDVIVIDIAMPRMNGIEATRSIRKEESHQGRAPICIIGMTAHARPEIKEECLAAGMDDVLIKPVQIKELFSAIKRCLSQEGKPLHRPGIVALFFFPLFF